MNIMILILLLLNVILSSQASFSNKPKVYWNLRTEGCKNSDGNPVIALKKKGIIHNERQLFNGDEIVIIYVDKVDKLPMINPNNHSDNRAGGIPQMINRTDYLAALEELIVAKIPNESFTGLGILDLEVFRPDWDLHWSKLKVYRNQSRQYVSSRKENSGLNETEVEQLAKKEFNEAVSWIFTETIRLSRKLRPSGVWGYYYYPFTFMDNKTFEGSSEMVERNNNLDWLWKESNALFPSFYFGDQITEKKLHFETVKVDMAEANRISSLYNLPVYSYTKFEYNAYNESTMFDYYNKACFHI